MALKMDVPETADGKKIRTRSPAYPYVNLEMAIRRAKEFYEAQQHHAAPLKVAVRLWGYEEKSSGGLQTAAALVSFGLLNDEGTGEARKIRLTPLALKILLSPDFLTREEAVKQVALTPKIHRQVWDRWGAKPPEASMRYALLTEWEPKFNPNTVDTFIREYRDTIAFAKLSESDKVASEVEDSGDKEPYIAQIGDWVQWERDNGDLGFPEPKRVKGLTPDGNWAYVDGQNGCVERNQLIRASAPTDAKPSVDPDPSMRGQTPRKTHMQEFVVPLSDGSKAVFQWPTVLTEDDVADLKDSIKILERKIARSVATEKQESPE